MARTTQANQPEGERSVSGELPERLSSVLADVEETITTSEASIAGSVDQLRVMLDTLEKERAQAQSDLEQRQLERLVQETDRDSSEGEGEVEAGYREAEAELSNAYARVAALYRQVVDFGHMLAAARKQFREEEALPGVEDAQDFSLQQAMIRAKEDERRRLSREIHDGPAQVLANAIIGLEFIERALRQDEQTAEAAGVQEVERIKGSMRDGLSEIRRFIFDLRPSMLAQRGLVGTVEHYLNAYRSFLPDEMSLTLPSKSPNLTEEQELTAFRVIQESLQNIHRHSDSTKCWISIESDETTTKVTIRDNGRGFQPGSVKVHAGGGSGIIGMQERAQVIGARLTVDSTPGQGSEVHLEIPEASQRSRDTLPGTVDQRGAR